jgi:16S rRNA (uracil1498-N3)-methyltransferase
LVNIDASQAHHIRDVLRLTQGTEVEMFDNSGRVGHGVISFLGANGITVDVSDVTDQPSTGLTIASAVPKGDRADWMIEKLSELGVDRFIPLATERSVVLPAGRNKIERWVRIAVESAKQSRRSGVMKIDELTPLAQAMASVDVGRYLSTQSDTVSIYQAIESAKTATSLTMFIGPEGGWSDGEIASFSAAKFHAVGLTRTVLRVETAAIAAAAVMACWHGSRLPPFSPP